MRLPGPFGVARRRAGLLVDVVEHAGSVLEDLARIARDLVHGSPHADTQACAEAAIPAPMRFVSAPRGVAVAPEGFAEQRSRRLTGFHAATPGLPIVPFAVPEGFLVAFDGFAAEAVLAAELADARAANRAQAELHVTQPWSGYEGMKAPDVIERLLAEPDHVLSLVLLYERAHRARRTVMAAAERELARRTARG